MKLLLTALTLLILVTVPVKTEANDKVGTKVFGVEAEDIIFHTTYKAYWSTSWRNKLLAFLSLPPK